MANIKILSPDLINQIAAGEVIERPASVLKELIENSIDAGSTEIEIFIQNSGQGYICVKDNGCGMGPEDLKLCIKRHATSKLTGKNLLDIHTFGFRGEALPSICSMSRIEIKSKIQNASLGWLLGLEGGNIIKNEPTSMSNGTIITVRDLFFTAPARLKFLKSQPTELAACFQQVKQLALANPFISFSFSNNNKIIFSYPSLDPSLPLFEALTQRVQNVLGEDFYKNSFHIHKKSENFENIGLISYPTYHGKEGQYLFINKRPIKDRTLSVAVKIAYQNVLIPGEQPSYVLFLTLDPQEVDMNVHPAKTEVRFRNSGKIKSFLIDILQNTLSQAKETSSALSQKLAYYTQQETKTFFNNQRITSSPLNNISPFLKKPSSFLNDTKTFNSLNFEDSQKINIPFSTPTIETKLVQTSPVPYLGIAKTQIFDSFIISQNEESMFLIDQHAAHERIVYEQIEKNLFLDGNGWILSRWPQQKLLFPLEVPLSDTENLTLPELCPYLSKMGFENIHKENQKILIVTTCPQICKNSILSDLIAEIIDELHHSSQQSILLEKIHKIFATHACHHSIRANHPLSLEEMNALLKQIETTQRSGQCNHGRPSYVKLSRKDIERLFERTG